MHKHIFLRICALALAAVFMLPLSACREAGPVLSPANPVNIVMWHYYSGAQGQALEDLAVKFNTTVGEQMGIMVEVKYFASAEALQSRLQSAVKDELQGMPSIFMTDTDSAYALRKRGIMADLGDYMRQEDISAYVSSFWQEGVFDRVPYIFPIQKSTEVLFVDGAAWLSFAMAAGLGSAAECMGTWENIARYSQLYYEYTDGMTPEEHDGMALFSVNNVVNYMQAGMRQLGTQLIKIQNNRGFVEFDDDVLRRMWDNYYIPMAMGWYADGGASGSAGVRGGTVFSYVGSGAEGEGFPDKVAGPDGTEHDTNLMALPVPVFQDGKKVTVQQGAGMVVAKSDIRSEYASVEFLKWLTESDRNLEFASITGCLPVRKDALTGDLMENMLSRMEQEGGAAKKTAQVLRIQLQQINSYEIYHPIPYEGSLEIRRIIATLKPIAAQARIDLINMLDEVGYEDAVELICGEDAFHSWLMGFKAEVEAVLATN